MLKFFTSFFLFSLLTSTALWGQFPLRSEDAAALTRMRNAGLIDPAYTVPSGTLSPLDTIIAEQFGIKLRPRSIPTMMFVVEELDFIYRRNNPLSIPGSLPYYSALDSMFMLSGLEFVRIINFTNNRLIGAAGVAQRQYRRNDLLSFRADSNELFSVVMVDMLVVAPNLQHLFLRSAFEETQNMPQTSTLADIPATNVLKTLDCSHNLFTVFHSEIFGRLLQLEVLDFSHNRISSVVENATYMANAIPKIGVASSNAPFSLYCYNMGEFLREIRLNNNELRGHLMIHHFIGKTLSRPVGGRALQVLDFRNNRFDAVSPLMSDLMIQNTIAPLAVGSYFSPTCSLRVDGNNLQFDDLFRLSMGFGKALPNGASIDFPTFTYNNQDSVGIGGTRRRGTGQPLDFNLQVRESSYRVPPAVRPLLAQWGVKRSNYGWTWGTEADIAANNTANFVLLATFFTTASGFNGNTSVTAPSNTLTSIGQTNFIVRDSAFTGRSRPSIGMVAAAGVDRSYVFSWATNDNFPGLTLHTRKKRIVVGDCLDSLGQPIVCQEIIVQTDPNATEAQLDSARAEFGAEVVESCHCGDVELWALSDTFQTVDLEANGAGTRSAIPSTRNKPGLRSADANYSMLPGTDTTHIDDNPTVQAVQGNTNASATLVAIIDSGTDPDHRILSPYIRYNQNEVWEDLVNPQPADTDGNCEKNDVLGYNYVDGTNVAYDDHGHGTAVGGIVAGFGAPMVAPTDMNRIALLPIKYTDRRGSGTTFHTACAIFYAADYHRNRTNGIATADSVRVINASWGYYGEESTILREAIEYADGRCGLLFVTSAGNDGTDNDAAPHYPANFDLPNVLAVASTDMGDNNLAAYSNYGAQSVHIAARGSFTSTLIPQSGNSADTSAIVLEGTSFSTALVSRAAALLFNQHPNASPAAVKFALMQTATPLPAADAAKIASGGKLNYEAALAYLAQMTDITACAEYTISVERLQGEGIRTQVFPNPTQGTLFLQFEGAGERRIDLLDAQGRLLSSEMSQEGNSSLSLRELPQGIYLLRIQSAQGLETHKVLKIN